ncbi:MAG: sigma-70 family RNA polymerase sigma factor [Verrucomicrobiota bacterium]|nr:sigma-70 family RNA polymerase sigma factor [Verrucomicrobiota bacterium]
MLAHRTMLKAYVHAIVRDAVLAEDTFSDVTLEIVRSWPRFDPARAFEPWARGLARRVALANLRKHNRPLVTLEEVVLESIGVELDQLGRETDHETNREALHRCLQKLSTANRALVRMRYFDELSYGDIARAVNRTPGALYVAFNRIHAALSRCVRQQQTGMA